MTQKRKYPTESLPLSHDFSCALGKIEKTQYITKSIQIKTHDTESLIENETINKRTSIRLTEYQWKSLEVICAREDISQSELFYRIAQRIGWIIAPENKYRRGKIKYSLSNAVRIFIVAYFRLLIYSPVEELSPIGVAEDAFTEDNRIAVTDILFFED